VEIVITRPEHQSRRLCDALRQQGYTVRAIPLLSIEPNSVTLPTENSADGWIFISPNAVDMLAQQSPLSLPALVGHSPVYAIGESTANHLQQHGIGSVIYPKPANSESLLALPELESVQNLRIILVCGVGGRELIESTLRQRGASLERLEVYRRQPAAHLRDQLSHVSQPLWIISSAAALAVLEQATNHPQRLLVTSERLAQLARKHQHQVAAISASALDRDIVNSLSQITAG
jgi:uroporphyrinogen-III synthase